MENIFNKAWAIELKYPELVRAVNPETDEDWDRYVCNDGQVNEIYLWNTEKYPKPSEEELLEWFEKLQYVLARKYDTISEQLDRIWHDIDSGNLTKTGQFYLGNKSVKDESPKT